MQTIIRRLTPVAVMAVLGSTAPLAAHASNYHTTSNYSSTSTSDDIADSCKNLWAGGSGTLHGECNSISGSNDDHISALSTTFDLHDAIRCPDKLDGSQEVIAWGDQSAYDDYVPNSFSVSVSSDGKNFTVGAVCDHRGSGTTRDRSTLDLGDTTNGIKNNNGAFAEW